MGVSSSRESRRGLLLAVSKLKREGCAPGRNPVKEEASVRFWRQEQSRVWRTGSSSPPQSQFADESATLPKGFPLLKRKQTQHLLSCL